MKKFGILSISALLMCACSSTEINELDPSNQETALLSISTSVLTQNTKAGVTRTTNGADGADKGPVMGTALAAGSQIGVCVYNAGGFDKYNGVSDESNPVHENLLWTNAISDKWSTATPFYVGNATADVYAYFPHTATTGATGFTTVNGSAPTVAVTAGYTDYLYGKGSAKLNTSASIVLNHALAMIYFTFKTDKSFAGVDADRVLTSIQLMNLPQKGTMSLNSTTGATATAETSSQSVQKYTTTGYTAIGTETIPASDANPSILGGDVANTPLLHYLVLPNTGMPDAAASGTLHAVVTIGGITYNVPLNVKTQETGNGNAWLAGKKYAYNLTLKSGMGTNNTLEVSSVTVTQWTIGGSSDVEL